MTFELGTLLTGLIGGLALFLYGMDQLTVALKSVAGSRMKSILSRMTGNRFKAAFAGMFVTSVIQSSSVTTVLVVGFISAGLLTLQQSIGVIMGANIGTTITAQIVAFKITHYALLLVAAGAGAYLFTKKEQVRQIGLVFLGLGLIFFGMDMMSNATRPLRTYEPFVDAMRTMDSPLYGILVAAGFTALVQSSSATTGLIIVLAGQGFITLEAGIALAFGANLGTCVTALLASIGKETIALRASIVHVLFNVIGILIWFAFINDLASWVREISPTAPELRGFERLAAETPRQIANAHTIFNVANTVLFIGFVGPLAKLVTRLAPDRRTEPELALKAKYLDEVLLSTPDLALDAVHRELQRIGTRTSQMVGKSISLVLGGNSMELRNLAGLDDEIDALHRQIVHYLGAVSTRSMNRRQSRLVNLYLVVNNNLESIADIVATNLVHAGLVREREDVIFSVATQEKFREMHKVVSDKLDETLDAINTFDATRAHGVTEAKSRVTDLAGELEVRLATRLTAEADERVTVFRLETELVEYLKRVYYFTKRMAREVTAYVGQP